jgi:hypothetical protein
MAIPVLSPSAAARAKEALGRQHSRLRAALKAGRLTDQDAEDFAVHVAAVNQSLAVMSRAAASPGTAVKAMSKAHRLVVSSASSPHSRGWRVMPDGSRPANSQPPAAAMAGSPARMRTRSSAGTWSSRSLSWLLK